MILETLSCALSKMIFYQRQAQLCLPILPLPLLLIQHFHKVSLLVRHDTSQLIFFKENGSHRNLFIWIAEVHVPHIVCDPGARESLFVRRYMLEEGSVTGSGSDGNTVIVIKVEVVEEPNRPVYCTDNNDEICFCNVDIFILSGSALVAADSTELDKGVECVGLVGHVAGVLRGGRGERTIPVNDGLH